MQESAPVPDVHAKARDRRGQAPRLLAVATHARRFLEPMWVGFLCDPWGCIEPPLSGGTCRVSAEFLAALAPDLGLHGWEVHGGPEAFVTAAGERVAHYWLSDGATIIDLTADQFGLDPVIVGPPDLARYTPGAALPLSDAARGHARCVDDWVRTWRYRGGEPIPSAVTAASVAAYAGPRAHELALALHGAVGKPLLVVGERRGAPHPVVADAGMVLDACGIRSREDLAQARGIDAHDARPVGPEELAALSGTVDAQALDAATNYARAHPALSNAILQAFYEARDRAQQDEADEAHEIEGAEASGSPAPAI